ncbi:MAG TPA: LysR family transcriptional regulator [Sorangium sp.]|nr:LysR family transcriptional regulator [Sorangium sp.]
MKRLFETEAFVVVSGSGSFTAVGTRFGITKSHISNTVTALETRLGSGYGNAPTAHCNLPGPPSRTIPFASVFPASQLPPSRLQTHPQQSRHTITVMAALR